MSRSTPVAVVALVVASLGLGAAPALAQAQPAQPDTPGAQLQQEQRGVRGHRFDRAERPDRPERAERAERGQRFHRGGGAQRMQGGMLQLVCSPRGTDRLERMFERVAKRLELTETQSPLFDDLRSAALIAQTDFADTCAAARPEAGSERPNFVSRLETRLKLDTARNEALSGLLPQLGAFYDSLSDEQKTRLEPRGKGEHPHRGDRRDRFTIELRPNRG